MIDPRVLAALRPLVEALDALNVQYQLGGSLASSIHGVPRSSLDVDLLVSLQESQIRSLIERLGAAYYVSEDRARDAVERGTSFNVIHIDTMLKIDLFVARADRFRRVSLERGRPEALGEGLEVSVTSPEDIILHKLLWFRKGGELSRQQWMDVIGVLKVQAGRLDLAYLRSWARDLDIGGLLEQSLSEASD